MTILRINDPCPYCQQGIMRATYEPYECRCDHCGYWWDQWTGKEIDPLTVRYDPKHWAFREEWIGDDE